MTTHIVIPARFSSTRLPGKPLLEIKGKPIIWHAYQRAIETGIPSIIVATDHPDIFDTVINFGGKAVMTKESHINGTERLAEVAKLEKFAEDDIVINLQGDEPLLPAHLIISVLKLLLDNPTVGISTLSCLIRDIESINNPNVVKVVKSHSGKALYFSRSPIPWGKFLISPQGIAKSTASYFRHVGLYAYRVGTLCNLASFETSMLESSESLEQLRALQCGIEIQVGTISEPPPHGVDDFEDYMRVKKLVEKKNGS